MPAVVVRVAPAHAEEVSASSEYMARIRARDSAVIAPLVAGKVTEIFVSPGDAVHKGEALVQIDPRRQQAVFQSSAAGAKSAESELYRAQSTLHQLKAQHVAKVAALTLATVQGERDTRLVAEGAISPSAFDQSKSTLRSARADADGARAAVAAQEAAVEAASRGISQARENASSQLTELKYYRVASPIDGAVGDVPVTVGEYVTPSTRITSVAKNAELDAYVSVPVERARDLHIGQRVDLLDSDRATIATTHVFFVSPEVDPDSQTVLVETRLDGEASPRVKASERVTARVVWSTERALTIPVTSITRINGQPFVFVVDGTPPAARQRPVRLGPIEGDDVVVEEGIKDGERVVIAGAQKLHEGAPVEPVP